MSILLFVLGLVDIIGSFFIFLSFFGIGYGFYFLWIIAIVHFIKGFVSLVSAGYFAAFIDVGSGVILVLAYFSIPMYYVLGAIIGILLLIKGVQSIIPLASQLART